MEISEECLEKIAQIFSDMKTSLDAFLRGDGGQIHDDVHVKRSIAAGQVIEILRQALNEIDNEVDSDTERPSSDSPKP